MLYNTRTYTVDTTNANAIVYRGPAHTLSLADKIELSRVYPKPTADFAGVARPRVKRTVSVVIDAVTGKRANAILEVSGSLPVGMAAADIDALLADCAAWINTADAKTLFKQLGINV